MARAGFWVWALSAACSSAAPPPVAPCEPSFGAEASFAIDPATLRARTGGAALVEKVGRSPYRYFRLLASEFGARTCGRMRDLRWHLPLVAIHGDAHVEQFVVTGRTHGLEDFDAAGFGPAVVDLVRYGSSLHLACREVPWPCDAEHAVGEYFRQYREALDHPIDAAPTPRVVERLRAEAPADRAAWLAFADGLMQALPVDREARYRAQWSTHDQLMSSVPMPAGFASIVRLGTLTMGIGSALERKVLVRVRGPTDAPDDDLVLEARVTTPPRPGECSWRPPHGGALHVLMMTSILGRRMPELYGFVPLDPSPGAREFWVQAWDAGYHELRLEDLRGQDELEEVARDAALQLAGHFWTKFPEPLRQVQRAGQLGAFDLVAGRARRLARELADEVVREHRRFVARSRR